MVSWQETFLKAIWTFKMFGTLSKRLPQFKIVNLVTNSSTLDNAYGGKFEFSK